MRLSIKMNTIGHPYIEAGNLVACVEGHHFISKVFKCRHSVMGSRTKDNVSIGIGGKCVSKVSNP